MYLKFVSLLECEDEVLIPEGGKHEIPKEFVTSEIFIDNTDILYGDIVNADVSFLYADITVKSEDAPVNFAERKLTEISVTLQGAEFLELGYVVVNQSLITMAVRSITDLTFVIVCDPAKKYSECFFFFFDY